MKTSKAALAYFALVFGAGFALGVVRTLWLVPRIGERNAELAETPLMLVAVFLAARFLVRRMTLTGRAQLLATGFGALALLLLAEAGVVVIARQESLPAYVQSRDPLAGTVYLLALLAFALAPLAVGRRAWPS